jgi:hypothetical protein
MLRAPRPDIVSESTFIGVGCGIWANTPLMDISAKAIAEKQWIEFIFIGILFLIIMF